MFYLINDTHLFIDTFYLSFNPQRFTNEEDKRWFDKTVTKVVNSHISEELGAFIVEQEPYFVDFLRDAPEPTGEEPEDADLDAPKIYELVCVRIELIYRIESNLWLSSIIIRIYIS